MIRLHAFLLCCLAPCSLFSGDWPSWRGPSLDGHADPDQDPPVELSAPAWSVEIPGRGHGSPIVYRDRVFLTSADPATQVQALHCIDRATGESRWVTPVHEGGFTQKLNKKATWASNTPATDGERIYVNFVNGTRAFTTALDFEGKLVWQTEICDYKVHQGYGSSPVIHRDLVIVSADNKLGGAVAGLDRRTGKEIWRVERRREPNYPSPVILHAAGKVQLFLTGTNRVSSFAPLTGKVNWEIEGATTECVTTTVTDGHRIFSSGGYPKNHVAAIEADGSGKIAWTTPERVYVPSMLVKDGHLYAVMDSGVTVCRDSATGEEKWKGRLGGNFSSSPVLVGDRIYAANESGTLYVFGANPAKLTVLAENRIAGEVFSSPAICDGEIFLRVADYEGERRKEKLVCFRK